MRNSDHIISGQKIKEIHFFTKLTHKVVIRNTENPPFKELSMISGT